MYNHFIRQIDFTIRDWRSNVGVCVWVQMQFLRPQKRPSEILWYLPRLGKLLRNSWQDLTLSTWVCAWLPTLTTWQCAWPAITPYMPCFVGRTKDVAVSGQIGKDTNQVWCAYAWQINVTLPAVTSLLSPPPCVDYCIGSGSCTNWFPMDNELPRTNSEAKYRLILPIDTFCGLLVQIVR